MKKYIGIVLLPIFFLLSGNLIAQDKKLPKKEQRKIERAEHRLAEKEYLQKRKAAYLEVIKDSSIVLEANNINFNNRMNHQVTANNFVKIHDEQIVVQTSNAGHIGYNGLGGVTILGNIISYKIFEGKESDDAIKVNVQFYSQLTGHSSLILTIQPSGYSTAYLTDNRGNNVQFSGNAYSVEGSTIYQGQTIFY